MRIATRSIGSAIGKAALTASLVFGLGVLPLAGCASKPADEAEPDATSQPAVEAAPVDTTSWKTLGDALASRTGNLSYGYDDDYFVAIFDAGDSIIRTVSKMELSIRDEFGELDFEDPDYEAKETAILADLELISAEDITSDVLSQEELDSYVGKTGQDMYDAGFVFSYYSMYGGEQTSASIDYGYFSYDVTFDTSIDESQSEDEGASLKDAKVVEVQSFKNLSNMSLDPTAVE